MRRCCAPRRLRAGRPDAARRRPRAGSAAARNDGARLTSRAPKLALRAFARELSPSDRALLAQLVGSPKHAMALITESFLRGAAGVVDDYARLARGWGFAVDAITIPVQLWHGLADAIVPANHTRALAERLGPTTQLHTWPREGHLAIATHIDQILDQLRAAHRSSAQ